MNAELVAALLPFFAACIAVELTPGPNMAYLALLGANRGRFAGFFAVAGVALGLLTIGLLAASGVSAVVESNRYVWEALRWAGVAYLLWLAYDTWLE
ncbi:MAG: LysE family transporter, partial [Cucumibacter sp.]